jgi:hypothetical protein
LMALVRSPDNITKGSPEGNALVHLTRPSAA